MPPCAGQMSILATLQTTSSLLWQVTAVLHYVSIIFVINEVQGTSWVNHQAAMGCTTTPSGNFVLSCCMCKLWHGVVIVVVDLRVYTERVGR
jgi:hypothetical protein